MGGGLDYRDNYLDRWNAGAHLQLLTSHSQTDCLIAHQRKQFGARGFYGVTPFLKAAERTDDLLVLASSRYRNRSDGYIRATALWRSFEDDYELPEIDYRNKHRSTMTAAMVDGIAPVQPQLALQWRVHAEEQRLDSRGLGDHRRTSMDFMLTPKLTLGAIDLEAGMQANLFTDDQPAYVPMAGVHYRSLWGVTVFLTYSEAVKRPSFTELFYLSPANIGTIGLERQTCETWEVGCEQTIGTHTDWRLALFRRTTDNTVDWVKTAQGTPWIATDLGPVKTDGGEVSLTSNVLPSLTVRASYAYLHKRHNADNVFAGRYVLDYPRHAATVDIDWSPSDFWSIRTAQEFLHHTKNRVRQGDHQAVNGSIEVVMRPPQTPHLEVVAGCDNMWSERFETYPGQPKGGRRFYAVARWIW